MKFGRGVFSLFLAVSACGAPSAVTHPARPARMSHASSPKQTITIATFNIQIFGKTKAHKAKVMAQLVDLICKYDVVALQEVKDVSGEAPKLLLDAVNGRGGRRYVMLLSPRTGMQDDDKSSQEQYAVLYDAKLLDALPHAQLFDDESEDLFQREPFLTHLRSREGGFSFVLIDIHTRPNSAVAEIGALHEVIEWARAKFPGEDDFIALGDYNAGCNYATPAQLQGLDLRGARYRWIVPDDSDSNVSAASACAYDRIVMTVATQDEFTGDWGVDRSFNDKAISDHWPVWARFVTAEH